MKYVMEDLVAIKRNYRIVAFAEFRVFKTNFKIIFEVVHRCYICLITKDIHTVIKVTKYSLYAL
jgi:hypothetical protein